MDFREIPKSPAHDAGDESSFPKKSLFSSPLRTTNTLPGASAPNAINPSSVASPFWNRVFPWSTAAAASPLNLKLREAAIEDEVQNFN